jgi:nicotinate phosphoribosyltransferase
MANGFLQQLPKDRATFDIFFRRVPDEGSFVIAAGLQQVVEELQKLHFDASDIAYFKQLKLYDEAFIDYLANFKLDCEITAVPEGTPIFPREPLMTIEGPLVQVQMLETLVLNILNHQSLIATKARRINYAAAGGR